SEVFTRKTWANQIEEDEEDYADSLQDDSDEAADQFSSSPRSNEEAARVNNEQVSNSTNSASSKKGLSPNARAFVPSGQQKIATVGLRNSSNSKAIISAHDRALLDALDTPTPHKFALSAGAQLLQSSELHRNFRGHVNDQVKDQAVLVSTDVVGTAAASTKVLSSGKVLGNPTANHAKQEWMQTRRNKYQRDRRGYIIEEVKEKGDNKGKGKINEGTVVSNNKFRALEVEDATLEVEEITEPILTIEEGKVENNGKNKGKEQEKLNTNKAKGSPNPSANRIGKTD
ncbi:hypothetical protein A4A49_44670, partial [Nicotiana attenuata]